MKEFFKNLGEVKQENDIIVQVVQYFVVFCLSWAVICLAFVL